MGKNRTQEEKQTEEKLLEEESMFSDQLPEEVLRELTPEIRRQYFLWDEILKREVELYPWLTLPLIEENFHKKYRQNTRIQLLSTEYTVSRIHKKRGEAAAFHSCGFTASDWNGSVPFRMPDESGQNHGT